MSELAKRIISAVLLGALLLGDLWLGSWWYAALLIVGGGLVVREFTRLVRLMRLRSAVRNLALLVGVAYVGAAMWGLWRVRAAPLDGLFWSAWLFLVVWATDIGAYVFGRAIGGPKIAPAISPSKTWAGLVGGVLCTAIVMNVMWAQLTGGWVHDPVSLLTIGLLWGAPLAVLAQSGDFFESWMKRRAGVKDSGSLIPGHGGLFDRVDGLLPVAIVFGPWMQVT